MSKENELRIERREYQSNDKIGYDYYVLVRLKGQEFYARLEPKLSEREMEAYSTAQKGFIRSEAYRQMEFLFADTADVYLRPEPFSYTDKKTGEVHETVRYFAVSKDTEIDFEYRVGVVPREVTDKTWLEIYFARERAVAAKMEEARKAAAKDHLLKVTI
jgi:hypothetical protein